MSKVKLELKGLSAPDLIQRTRGIKRALTDNATFPSPTPTLAAVEAQAAIVEGKLNARSALDKQSQGLTVEIGAESDKLQALLGKLGEYVDGIAGGDEAKIKSGGFGTVIAASPIGALAAPTDFSATMGDSAGEIDSHWHPVRGAKSYLVEATTDINNAGGWGHTTPSTKSKGTIPGLASGIRHWLRCCAVGAAGKGPWSDPATAIAA